jgi:hypothetical protein
MTGDKLLTSVYGEYSSFQERWENDANVAAFAESTHDRMLLPLDEPSDLLYRTITHELTHIFQFDITSQVGGQPGGIPGAVRMPLWFIEGMAEFLSIGPVDANTAMWMRDTTSIGCGQGTRTNIKLAHLRGGAVGYTMRTPSD